MGELHVVGAASRRPWDQGPRPDGARRPRLGFVGVGWIGRGRMEAVHRAGAVDVAAIADRDADAARLAAAAVGCLEVMADIEDLLLHDLDGVVIGTPTALHAAQAELVLEHGLPVFCQKPLGRTESECRGLIELARRADVTLGVDMSYRYVHAVQTALAALRAGRIGEPHFAELVFHNAYGPDKDWAFDIELAGGGALIDLGPHLIDLARMFFGELEPIAVHGDLFASGRRLRPGAREIEDLALAQVTLGGGRALRIACSWWLPAGADAVIEASFLGEGRALTIRNLDGSYYDFEARLIDGRQSERIAGPPDDWGGRALIDWVDRVAGGGRYDPDVEQLIGVAALIDRIYGPTP